MSRTHRLHTIISAHLAPQVLQIEDESHQHHVPAGAESHFKVCIVSEQFQDKTRVARHRLVNHLIQQEFDNGLHALSLHLFTPEEWADREKPVQPSPNCRGGSRHSSNP
jgi:BolA protein